MSELTQYLTDIFRLIANVALFRPLEIVSI